MLETGVEGRRRFGRALAVLATTAATALAACGGDDNAGGGSGGEPTGPAADAKSLSLDKAQNASGDITYCIGGSLEGHKQVIKRFNDQGQVNVKLVALPESADEQRQQQIQRLQAKSKDCDVVAMDVIWTAEYASQGWLYDLTPVVEERKSEFIESTLDSANYQGKYWGLPNNSNAGFVYYKKSASQQAPDSWEKVYEMAGQGKGLVYQGGRYEGLTVNFLELLYSAGGKVLSDDGKTAEIDSQQARDVLKFMVDGIQNGASPKAVTTYKEEEARRAFESGKADFMRNWPYAYSLANQAGLKGEFDIAPFPSYGGAEGAGVLGGYNLGINASSDNPEGALAFVNYYASPEAQKILMAEASLPAVLKETYDDPDVQKAAPFAEDLRQAISQAQPRPVSPVYPQISEAIYGNVHDALTGKTSPDEAVTKMNDEISAALQTF